MSYTHICIKTAKDISDGSIPHIFKGQCATLIRDYPESKLNSKRGFIFKEDPDVVYCAELFLPLPPQQEKTVYVAVSEEITKEIAEPVLN